MLRLAAFVLVWVLAVIAADVIFSSSILNIVRPQIVEPPDGAITAAPVVVSWDGPRPMQVTLVGSGTRVDLGLRDSPFSIEAKHFPKPGRYRVEMHSPLLGGLIQTQRRFHIQPSAAAAPAPPAPASEPRRETATPNPLLNRLRAERDQIESERLALAEQKATLERENRELAQEIEDLRGSQDASDQRLSEVESQRSALAQEHAQALQDNAALRQQLDNIPACTTWGYLALARNQAVPRRVVQVSNARGDVFRSLPQCLSVRRGDPSAISPCACVGAVGQGIIP